MENLYTILIGDEEYCDIAKFVEEVYLSDSDLVILMARKFFTLFMIFQELNCQKYEKIGIPYKSDKKIITNVALPLYQDTIEQGLFKKIIIADDIIIHGRTISRVYQKIKEWNEECDVRIMSYVRNDEDKKYYEKIFEHFHARYLVEADNWKSISTKIVNSFYMAGRPYISYLPFFTIKNDWEQLIYKLGKQDCYEIDNETMRANSVQGVLYTGDVLNSFQKQEFCNICALRLYHYRIIDKIVVVPYFCMAVINNQAFCQLSDSLRKNRLKKEYLDLVEHNRNSDEMRLVELEYVLSYWMAVFAVEQLSLSVDRWNYDSEECSFGMLFLKERLLSANDILTYLCELRRGITVEITKPEPKGLIQNKEISILAGRYKVLLNKYRGNYKDWYNLHKWGTEESSYEKRFLEELLSVNGKIDEKRLEQTFAEQNGLETEESQEVLKELRLGNGTEFEQWLSNEKNGTDRLLGLPLAFVLQDMGESFKGTTSYDSVDKHRRKVFADVISVVDSGKGSIFTRIVKDDTKPENSYYESLLHAGEQNFVFYENTNFPTMYAFYIIEQVSSKKIKYVDRMKEDFLTCFKNYLEENKIYFDEEEMQQLKEIDMSQKYGRYLQDAYYRHQNNPILKQAIEKALIIVAKKQYV